MDTTGIAIAASSFRTAMWALPFITVTFMSAAAVAAPPLWRRVLAFAIGLGGLAIPFAVAPEHTLIRGLLAVGTGWAFCRLLELMFLDKPMPLAQRLWHSFGMIDTRRVSFGRPRIEPRKVGHAVIYAVPAALGFYTAEVLAPQFTGVAHWVIRWAGGAAFVYCFTDTAYAVAWSAYRAIGVIAPELHRAPLAARSVGEFWGRRWNRTVSTWLRLHCFNPLARRGMARAGLALAFVTSAVLHAYVALVPLGFAMAGWMSFYFVVQGMFVLIENALGVTRWPALASRIWTVAVMTLTSPLFVEPLMRAVEG